MLSFNKVSILKEYHYVKICKIVTCVKVFKDIMFCSSIAANSLAKFSCKYAIHFLLILVEELLFTGNYVNNVTYRDVHVIIVIIISIDYCKISLQILFSQVNNIVQLI